MDTGPLLSTFSEGGVALASSIWHARVCSSSVLGPASNIVLTLIERRAGRKVALEPGMQ